MGLPIYTLLFDKIGVIDYLTGLSVFKYPVRILLCGTRFNGVLWYLYAAFWAYCMLCKEYSLDPLADEVVICHQDGFQRGAAIMVLRGMQRKE